METGLTKSEIITELTKSPHRDLQTYVPKGWHAAKQDPEFYAHLIAWNHQKGEVRDAKAALPVIHLAVSRTVNLGAEFDENALAHLADLNPRLLVRALDFGKTIGAPKNLTHRFVARYLRDLEGHRREFEATAVQHRQSLRRLYTFFHVKPSELAQKSVLEASSVEGKFGVVKSLPSMSPMEIVAAVDEHKLPWLIVRGALGPRAKDPDVLMAFLGRMTAADLSTNAKWLARAGVMDHPHTRAAFEAALTKAGKPRRAKGTTLKAGKKAKEVARDLGDEKVAGKLVALQERQLEHLRTIEGNWLIIGDKSSSMQLTIETAKRVASVLSRLVKGAVYLVFCDTSPRFIGNVSGMSLESIEEVCRAVRANGGTSLGCGLQYARERKLSLDGIAVVSDGAENSYPLLSTEYELYASRTSLDPTVYWYRTPQDTDPRSPGWIRQFELSMQRSRSSMTTFDIRAGVDDYSLPNLVQTMRVGKYSLLDEIMGTRLRRLDEVLSRTTTMEVMAHVGSARKSSTV